MLTFFTGCASVANEMMFPIQSEEYIFSQNPQHVWQASSNIIESRIKGNILIMDQDNLIISWMEHLNAPLENIKKPADDPKSDKEKLYENEVLEVGDGGISITTVSIRSINKGSMMRIRRVYYGRYTQPRMVHSRGTFANLFQKIVKQELTKNANNKI